MQRGGSSRHRGRDGGYHCLMSCLGAGSDLAVLPWSEPDLPKVAKCIANRRSTVIAVAEGYGRKEREELKFVVRARAPRLSLALR